MRVVAAMTLMVLMALAGPAAPPLAPSDLVGSWEGVIRFPDVALRMRFEIKQQPGGGLEATFDSLDQGARSIPIENASLNDHRLHMAIQVLDSTYEGEVNETATYITGQWRQGAKNSVPLNLEKVDPSNSHAGPQLSPAELAASKEAAGRFCGVWEGTLDDDEKAASLRVKIWCTQNGAAKGTLDIYERQIFNLPIRAIRYDEGHLRFQAPGLGASFEGSPQPGADVVSGHWDHSGKSTGLTLKKAPPPQRKGS